METHVCLIKSKIRGFEVTSPAPKDFSIAKSHQTISISYTQTDFCVVKGKNVLGNGKMHLKSFHVPAMNMLFDLI